MAKGRKLSTSRSELFLGNFAYNNGQGTVNGGALELGEEEIWSMVDNTVNGDNPSEFSEWSSRASSVSNGSSGSHNTRRQPPRSGHRHHQVGGLSLAFDGSSNTASQRIIHQYCPQDSVAESPRSPHMATSAPLKVPDWSKIYRVNSVESLHDSDEDLDHSELIPPHEYLARSRRIATNSVFEGVGRTLKGRDLSRVRDAVWSQTGFDG